MLIIVAFVYRKTNKLVASKISEGAQIKQQNSRSKLKETLFRNQGLPEGWMRHKVTRKTGEINFTSEPRRVSQLGVISSWICIQRSMG